ncbi:MAG: hypothetical protein AB1777_11250 [Bacteroidota bacterium]
MELEKFGVNGLTLNEEKEINGGGGVDGPLGRGDYDSPKPSGGGSGSSSYSGLIAWLFLVIASQS